MIVAAIISNVRKKQFKFSLPFFSRETRRRSRIEKEMRGMRGTDEVGELHDELGFEDGDDGLPLQPHHLPDHPVFHLLLRHLPRCRRRRRGPPLHLHQRPGGRI